MIPWYLVHLYNCTMIRVCHTSTVLYIVIYLACWAIRSTRARAVKADHHCCCCHDHSATLLPTAMSSGSFLTSTPFAVGGYMLCSACLLISNKLAIHLLPAPSFILFAQLMGTVIVVQGANLLGYIKVDNLEMGKAIKFLPVALIFLLTIFMNMKSLQYANVETFMIFRSRRLSALPSQTMFSWAVRSPIFADGPHLWLSWSGRWDMVLRTVPFKCRVTSSVLFGTLSFAQIRFI